MVFAEDEKCATRAGCRFSGELRSLVSETDDATARAEATMTRIEYLFRQFETIYEWYKRAEDKAGLLIGLNTLALGVVNGLVFVGADGIRAAQGLYTPVIGALLACRCCARCARDTMLAMSRPSRPRGYGFSATLPR
jgi:hypothetical protein